MIEGLTKELFMQRLPDLISTVSLKNDRHMKAAAYTDIMDAARGYGIEEETEHLMQQIMEEYGEPELWETPQSFDKPVVLTGFPVDALPDAMKEYLEAVAQYVQVAPEMAALPLLSVLSLCVQGKAVMKHPGSDHTEELNLYTLTIAAPGERKSGSYKEFMRPVEAYEKHYNEIHKNKVEDYRTRKAYLEQQKQAAMKGTKANLDRALELTRELSALEPVHPLKLNINDVTPEALAWEMYLQGGRIGIVDDEGSVFDVLSGLYTGGQVNINIFLKAYDGSSYRIIRRTKEDIDLEHPLLTMGLMVQPNHFDEAMNNKQFSGRGFIYRFLFSFPESRAGFRSISSDCIPQKVRKKYNDLVTRLLQMEAPDKPHVLTCTRQAFLLFEQYFNHIEEGMRTGGHLEHLKEWANKQFGRCLKIAGILHLCEHQPTEQVDELTALHAVHIAMWAENHALKALSGDMTDTQEVKDAKYILSKLRQSDKDVLTKHELLIMCRPLKSAECEIPLGMLEDMKCIKVESTRNSDRGRAKVNIKINPLILK